MPDPFNELVYDGQHPAPGTTVAQQWRPTSPQLRGDRTHRHRMLYDNVINQFAVEVNPRYKQVVRGGARKTWCNIFSWDVTRAMDAEIPHWVNAVGEPVEPGTGNELTANALLAWLGTHGGRYEWRRVGRQDEAQRMANLGHPTVALKATGGIGHIAVIRPGPLTTTGPTIAQAGALNANRTTLYSVLGPDTEVELWTNDAGTEV